MADIADLLGKSSIDTDYAIATTVKTARLTGVTVLEAYDLSKFAVDTPVYFITYKKTTNPLTGAASVTDLVSWKALVNAGANTLTNMTVAPGYTDIGNDVGDFIECVPTSYWENSLIDGIQAHANPDGTLKTAAVQAALNLGNTPTAGWEPMGQTITAVAANGNRSYTLTYNASVASTLSPGMRLQTQRTVAAPTQCTSLNGTTQYYSCASANLGEMTFTDDFVVGAWVKLSSYGTGGVIASRFNGTSGWQLVVIGDGTIRLQAFNGGGGNTSIVYSYQSIPLNKWVHITAQLDMSAFTATPTTSYIMLDGVNVPAYVGRFGTNPTVLIQAGNLEIGSVNGGTSHFPGKIAQAFVSSAKITQANVRTLMSQGLTPALISAHSIISAYSFDNAITDLNTTSANNLTANGSAVATNADSPFGGQGNGTISSTLDYGIVQAVSASTVTVQVAEGCTIPTSGGVSAVSYSTQKVPYGFPGNSEKWKIIVTNKTNTTLGIGALSISYASNYRLTVPIGAWNMAFDITGTANATTSVSSNNDGAFWVAATSTSTDIIPGLYIRGFTSSATNYSACISGGLTGSLTVAVATDYSVWYTQYAYTGGAASMTIRGDMTPMQLYATNAYL